MRLGVRRIKRGEGRVWQVDTGSEKILTRVVIFEDVSAVSDGEVIRVDDAIVAHREGKGSILDKVMIVTQQRAVAFA